MIDVKNRAEVRVYDALLADAYIKKTFGAKKIFQGYVAADSVSKLNEYISVARIGGPSLDRTLDGPGDSLRLIRLQIDVVSVEYVAMITYGENVRRVLSEAFHSCVVDDGYGKITAATKVLNVQSIDVLLTEQTIEV